MSGPNAGRSRLNLIDVSLLQGSVQSRSSAEPTSTGLINHHTAHPNSSRSDANPKNSQRLFNHASLPWLSIRVSGDAAQSQIAPRMICGQLPAGFDPKSYSTRPWKITRYIHDGDHIDLGGRSVTVAAFDSVRDGKVAPAPSEQGTVLYKVGDISFVMDRAGKQ